MEAAWGEEVLEEFSSDEPSEGAGRRGREEDPRIQDWVRRALAGESEAFDAIVAHFEGRVWALAYQIVGDAEDARDAAQEAFLRVYRYLRRFRVGEPFTPWLLRIAVHASYRQLRRARPRLDLVPLEEAGEEAGASAAPAAERSLLASERERALLRALDALSPRERVVFVLREMQGLPTEEVARVLRIRAATVRRHASRAREHLLRILRERWPDLLEC